MRLAEGLLPDLELNYKKLFFQNSTYNRMTHFNIYVVIKHHSDANNRHFSHVIKSRIFKNLDFWKPIATFAGLSWKLYSNTPSWLPRSRFHMGTFWKTKDWSSHYWENQSFRFWYVGFHCQRRNKSTKTGISS